jgi:hypothetical protein
MKQQSNQRENKHAIDEILKTFYLQAKAQFGSGVQSCWLHDNNLCPGCGRRSTGEIKVKGQGAPLYPDSIALCHREEPDRCLHRQPSKTPDMITALTLTSSEKFACLGNKSNFLDSSKPA